MRSTLFFILLLMGWSTLLWLVTPIAIVDRPLFAIGLLHLAPPAIVMIALSLLQHLRLHLRRKNEQFLLTEKINNEKLELIRQRELQETQLRARRTGLEIRWAGIGDGYLSTATTKPNGQSANTCHITSREDCRRIEDHWPNRPLTTLFGTLFTQCPFATFLPLIIARPRNPELGDALGYVTESRRLAIAQQTLMADSDTEVVVLNRTANSIHTELISQLSEHPDWPGAIVVAFDRADDHIFGKQSDSDSQSPDHSRVWLGTPNQGMTVILVTPSTLSDALASSQNDSISTPSNLLPFWQRQQYASNLAKRLTNLPYNIREKIPPVIATLHRAQQAEKSSRKAMHFDIEETQALIFEAAVDAGLVDPPFPTLTEIHISGNDKSAAIASCGWLVHNSGDISCGGERLATLSRALCQNSIDVNPIDEATNIVMTFGNCNGASEWLQLTHAAHKVAGMKQPVCSAFFNERTLSISFLTPPSEAASTSIKQMPIELRQAQH